MKLFRKRKSAEADASPAQDRIAGGIAACIQKTQQKWVHGMERLSSKLSRKSKIALFSAYLVFTFLACGYSVLRGVLNWNSEAVIASSPKMPVARFEKQKRLNALGNDPIQKRIEAFGNLMDSLGKTQDGMKVRDSLLRARPGLADSLTQVKQILGNN